MDYKEKYEEALERAKMYQGMNVLPAESMIEIIFPELKDGQDEKIREHLLRHFRNKTKEEWNGIPIKNIIAWLEKQGKKQEVEGNPNARKPALRIIKGKSYLCIKDYRDKNCTFIKGKIYKSDKDGFLVDDEEKDAFERKIWEEDAIEYFFLFEQSKTKNVVTDEKQKPAWSEKYIADVFEKVGLAKIVREQSNDNLTNALQDAMIELGKFISQPKPAWSEEDKRMIDTIIYDLERHGGKEDSCYSAEINWLKSLKERVHLEAE